MLFEFLGSQSSTLRVSSSTVLVKIFSTYKDTSILKENLNTLLYVLSTNDRKLTSNTMSLLQHIQNGIFFNIIIFMKTFKLEYYLLLLIIIIIIIIIVIINIIFLIIVII